MFYRYSKRFVGKIIGIGGIKKRVSLFHFVRPRKINIKYDLVKIENELESQGILKKYFLRKSFPYSVCDAADFLKFSLEKLNENPLYFLTQETQKILEKDNILEDKSLYIKNFD